MIINRLEIVVSLEYKGFQTTKLLLVMIYLFSFFQPQILRTQTTERWKEMMILSNMDTIANGKKLFGIELENLSGESVKLDELKGKYVLIYIWSTYCGPCLQTLNESSTIIEEFEDVKFVFISIDDDKSRWEKLLKRKNYGGIHLHTNQSKEPPISYLIYRIKMENDKMVSYQGGLPTVLLLDENKNIVENNVPQYSTQAIIQFLRDNTAQK